MSKAGKEDLVDVGLGCIVNMYGGVLIVNGLDTASGIWRVVYALGYLDNNVVLELEVSCFKWLGWRRVKTLVRFQVNRG